MDTSRKRFDFEHENKNLTSVMSRAGYTGHHINSVDSGSLGQNGKATHEILYFCLIVTILEELTIIYILIKGVEVAGPI